MESRLIFRHRRVERSGDTTRESSLLVDSGGRTSAVEGRAKILPEAGDKRPAEVREVRRRKPELRSTLLSRKAAKH